MSVRKLVQELGESNVERCIGIVEISQNHTYIMKFWPVLIKDNMYQSIDVLTRSDGRAYPGRLTWFNRSHCVARELARTEDLAATTWVLPSYDDDIVSASHRKPLRDDPR